MSFSDTKHAKRADGFTLLEVMIAIAILGFGLLVMAAAQLSALNTAARSQQLSQSTYLAEEQMEALMLRPANDPIFSIAGEVEALEETSIKIEGTSDRDQHRFDRKVTVEPDQPEDGMATITIEVTWTNTNGDARRTTRLKTIRPFEKVL